MRLRTYAEVLQVVQRHTVAEKVKKSILQHASVAVPAGLSAIELVESQLTL